MVVLLLTSYGNYGKTPANSLFGDDVSDLQINIHRFSFGYT